MLPLFFLLMLESTQIRTGFTLPVPDVIYEIEDMVVTKDAFFLLDYRSRVLVKVDREGNLLAIREEKGQGPGEFQVPISVTVGDGKVFVSDIYKMHIFTEEDLSFIADFKFFGNAYSMEYFKGELFLGTYKYPLEEHAIYVFSPEGKVKRSFYEHKMTNEDDQPAPFMDQDRKGNLYVQHKSRYQVDILDPWGKKVKALEVRPSPRYRPIVPYDPFHKKYGPNLAAYNHWRTEYSESRGIALEKERFLWVYFRDLQKDLRTEHHYSEVYDLESGEKIISWLQLPGGLFDGGTYAYVVEELDSGDIGEYRLQIKGLEVVP